MAAPLKPWERAGVNSQNPGSLPSSSMSGVPPCCQGNAPAGGAPSVAAGPPPAVPTRPTQGALGSRPFMSQSGYGMNGMSSYGGYSPMTSYGGMYSSPYSSYGGYGYGGYGGYNRFGQNQDTYSTFARQAEENSRPAFQAIENLVSAVSSVGMMMDSTFQAVYNSFRAVIGVADNMSRLRAQLISVVSALAFIRTLKYIFRRFLELIRLRPPGYASQAWNDAVYEAAASMPSGEPGQKKTAWPIFMFFGIILGGPYLIWKLIRSFSDGADENGGWASGDDDHFVARAEYTFQGNTNEVSFSAGQMINIAPKEMQPKVRGWLLGCVDGKTVGLLPANYVKVLGKRRGKKSEMSATPSGPQPTPLPITPTPNSLSLNEPLPYASTMNSDPQNNLDNMFQEADSSPANMDASDILDNFGSSEATVPDTGKALASQETSSESCCSKSESNAEKPCSSQDDTTKSCCSKKS